MRNEVKGINPSVLNDFAAAVSQGHFSDDEAVLCTYAFDSSPVLPAFPDCVLLPRTVQEVKNILEIAHRARTPVTTMSGGVNVAGGCVPSQGGVLMDLRWMNRIIEINTDSGYAVIEPGVNFDQLTSALRAKGFRCHVPTAPGGATPVGNYLSKPAGSLSTRHLDSFLGLEVVLPGGRIVKTGSGAFPFTGMHLRYGPFPDLTGLFCCSYGTLGTITKAAIRIYPINEAPTLSVSAFSSYGDSLGFVKEAVNNNIAEHCIIWNWHFYRTYDIVFPAFAKPEVPPDLFQDPHHPPRHLPYNLVTVLMSGFKEDMESQIRSLSKVAERYNGHQLTREECQELIPGAIRSWEEFYLEYRQPKMEHNKKYGLGRYMPWIVQAEPKDVIQVEKGAIGKLFDLGCTPVCYYSQPFDYGHSIFFRMFAFVNPQDPDLLEKVRLMYQDMYEWAMRNYGAIPFRHRRDPTILPRLGGYYTLLLEIKKLIDPHNIMNPGIALF